MHSTCRFDVYLSQTISRTGSFNGKLSLVKRPHASCSTASITNQCHRMYCTACNFRALQCADRDKIDYDDLSAIVFALLGRFIKVHVPLKIILCSKVSVMQNKDALRVKDAAKIAVKKLRCVSKSTVLR
jgi:hypothetical protein